MSASKSSQGNRVQQELEVLRQKQLAKNQRDKLKDCKCSLCFEEEVRRVLNARNV